MDRFFFPTFLWAGYACLLAQCIACFDRVMADWLFNGFTSFDWLVVWFSGRLLADGCFWLFSLTDRMFDLHFDGTG